MYHYRVPDHIADEQIVPRRALIALGVLVAFALVAITAASLTGTRAAQEDLGAPALTRALLFETAPGDGMVVRDAASGAVLETLPRSFATLLDAALQDFAAARRAAGADPALPYVLAVHRGGTVTLGDDATGRRLPLDAFGYDNALRLGLLLTATASPGSLP